MSVFNHLNIKVNHEFNNFREHIVECNSHYQNRLQVQHRPVWAPFMLLSWLGNADYQQQQRPL